MLADFIQERDQAVGPEGTAFHHRRTERNATEKVLVAAGGLRHFDMPGQGLDVVACRGQRQFDVLDGPEPRPSRLDGSAVVAGAGQLAS